MEKNAPASVETILVPDPGPGEALADILTCGVCHTDLHCKQGGITDEFPILLGHEATDVVSAVGPGVTEVPPSGCGVMAGIGAAINTGEVKRGESVAVIGCGAVDIAAIAGVKLAQAFYARDLAGRVGSKVYATPGA